MAMDKTTIIVCSVVGSLGVLSSILGFSAEGTKLTPNDILVLGDECIYPQNPALGLGICATIFLLAAQITVTAVGGSCGCCKSRAIPSETKRIIAIVCAVVSWIAAVIAWALLIQGAAWNANVARVTAPDCFYLKDGIFAGGAVFTLAATALGLASFVMLRRQAANNPAAAAAVHATGQPQFPPAPAANKPIEHPPHAVVAMGQPQFWPAAPQPPPSAGSTMGQAHQQFPPAAAAGVTPNKPGEQPPPTWVPTGHPQFSPPQAYAQPQPASYPAQYPVQPHQVYVQEPVLPPTAPPPQDYGQQAEAPAGVRGDLIKAGAKLLMRVVGNSLSSSDDNTATSTTGDGVQATDNGVAN
ncbi:hypothetical protein C2845_PM05G36980 [Panicum miliaceum]|uniref:Uncharacterized protein n=1 Tax=Panicum miliaceum TaxID=4540 RepID=A0A3L6T2E7_PANMI|nr:hypothetical protein C2845_PM05G36980 [Panicum miliaceum]